MTKCKEEKNTSIALGTTAAILALIVLILAVLYVLARRKITTLTQAVSRNVRPGAPISF